MENDEDKMKKYETRSSPTLITAMITEMKLKD